MLGVYILYALIVKISRRYTSSCTATHLQPLQRALPPREEVLIHEQIILPHIRPCEVEHDVYQPRSICTDAILDERINDL